MSKDDDTLSDAKEAFTRCEEAESHNRIEALDDLKFAKLEEQWPEAVKRQRVLDGRPCLTSSMMAAFIRQVVNEARQNRPSIQVHPADSKADVQTAKIYDGLIRNIERTSKADVAYDTAVDCAVTSGFGYFRINTDYAYEDTFDLDLMYERIANPFSVYGDPLSTSSDSSDWNVAFVTELLGFDAFKAKYPGAEKSDWNGDYSKLPAPWVDDETVLIAEWWTREQVKRTILMLSDGSVVAEDVYKKQKDTLDAQQITVLGERQAPSHKVTQRIMTGAEVLETNEWAGKYIPIVPVYGDEINVEGKRYFRSLIRSAKDEQRMRNYYRTASVELTALAPRVPFIGRKGAFKSDARKWATVNSANHSFIEYDGEQPPARQPLDSGRAIGAIQETANATDSMKAILGLYDPSLGAEGQEVSGKAILARQAQGHTSNFHFLDNLNRGVEHGGRILIDLIPTVYTGERMIRVLGYDGKAESVPLGQPYPVKGPDGQPQTDPETQLPMTHIIDLSRGKYDLTVETGPSSGTRRQELVQRLTEIIQAFPAAAPILGDIVIKNMDLPDGGEEIAKRLEALLPPEVREAQNPMQHPAVQQIMQQGQQVIQQQGEALQKLQQQVGQLSQENQSLQQDSMNESKKLDIDAFEAETRRLQAVHAMSQPTKVPATTGT